MGRSGSSHANALFFGSRIHLRLICGIRLAPHVELAIIFMCNAKSEALIEPQGWVCFNNGQCNCLAGARALAN